MKQITRGSFLSTSITLTAGTVAMALPLNNDTEKKQLVHHVFFWLKNPDSLEDRNKLVEGLKTLGKIDSIRKMHLGIPASTEKREVVDNSWQVSEIMFFDDEAGQKIYQDHPIHQAFVKNYSHLWDKVVVFDVAEL
jgi:hypothetical protein